MKSRGLMEKLCICICSTSLLILGLSLCTTQSTDIGNVNVNVLGVNAMRMRHNLDTQSRGRIQILDPTQDNSGTGSGDEDDDKIPGIKPGEIEYEADKYEEDIKTDWDQLPRWLQVVLCIAGIIVALVEIYFGYRVWPFTVFIATGFLAFMIMFFILVEAVPESSDKSAYVYGFSALAFILVGTFFLFFRKVAVFIVGAMVGVVLAFILNPIALHYAWPSNPEATLWIFAVLFGIIFGVITVYFERVLVILGSVMTGSLILILSIGGIAGHLPVTREVINNPDETKWQGWAYLGGGIFAIASGFLIQFFVTGKDLDHRDNQKRKSGGYTALR